VDVASDRDRIDLEYRNRGYESVVVDPRVMLADGDTRANVLFTITEGPQVLVDHVIIVGNRRTSTATIQRELTLKPGEPLGYAARIESQQRLTALGLFRRINITELTHSGESRRDVLVQVEEAPPTSISYGGGLEGQTILRPTGPNGQAEERFELAPRGSFEITRSNLWGKNRSLDLFTRASLKPRDILATGSSATIVAAPAMRAPWIADCPTPPSPLTATDAPGTTLAVLKTAQTPVVTPQPISASWSSGRSVATGTSARSSTIIASANVPSVPRPACTSVPSVRRRRGTGGWGHSAQISAWPPQHQAQRSHGATQLATTRSPARRVDTLDPTLSTTPAPS
jgi:hypothetical protein